MPGEDTIEEHYRVAYQRALGAEYQQASQRLGGTVDDDYNFTEEPGKSFTADIVGTGYVREITDRYGDTPPGDNPDRRRRGGHFTPFEVGHSLGTSIDKARSVADPANRIVQEEKKAIARHHDDKIMAGIIGASWSGELLTNEVPLPTGVIDPAGNLLAGNVIAKDSAAFGASGDTALTPAKIQHAKEVLDTREVPDDGRFCAASGHQLAKLLDDEKLSSGDYNTVKALVNGEINTWHGFTFVRFERITAALAKAGIVVPTTDEEAIIWHRDAIQYKSRMHMAPNIFKRQEKRFNWETYGQWESAACRTHEEPVLRIVCAR